MSESRGLDLLDQSNAALADVLMVAAIEQGQQRVLARQTRIKRAGRHASFPHDVRHCDPFEFVRFQKPLGGVQDRVKRSHATPLLWNRDGK